jgi:hypothetical protein
MAVTAYTGALTVIADVKIRLGITESTDNDLLQTMVNGASRMLDTLTGRLLKQRTYTNVRFNGNGEQFFTGDPVTEPLGWSLSGPDTIQQSAWGRRLETPLDAPTAISLGGVVQTIGDDPATNDVQSIILGKPSGLGDGLYRASGWPRDINNITMTYKGGFATVPDDLAEAAILTVMAWWTDKDRKYTRMISFGAQGESVTLERTAIPSVARDLIQPFTRIRMVGI